MGRVYAGSRIGIDLDNTLICYDRLFYRLAVELGLVSAETPAVKREIRDRIRLLPDGELEWRRLQAQAYGPAITGASAADGALEFITAARRQGAELTIVSHKTAYSNLGGQTVNLHDAARTWLVANGIVALDAIAESNVYFEKTRAQKIRRIIALKCTHFIDDLQEVFDDARFPSEIERILYASPRADSGNAYRSYASFAEIALAFAN